MSKPQATSLDHREAMLFRGREKELALAQSLWSAPLPAAGRRALLFFGIGGIGKSAFGRQIVREIGRRLEGKGWLEVVRPAFASINLAEAAAADPVQALLQLRLQLALTWRDARFDFAFARIHEARYPGSDIRRQYAASNPDGAVLRRLAPALAEMPLIGIAYKYLDRVVAKGLGRSTGAPSRCSGRSPARMQHASISACPSASASTSSTPSARPSGAAPSPSSSTPSRRSTAMPRSRVASAPSRTTPGCASWSGRPRAWASSCPVATTSNGRASSIRWCAIGSP